MESDSQKPEKPSLAQQAERMDAMMQLMRRCVDLVIMPSDLLRLILNPDRSRLVVVNEEVIALEWSLFRLVGVLRPDAAGIHLRVAHPDLPDMPEGDLPKRVSVRVEVLEDEPGQD